MKLTTVKEIYKEREKYLDKEVTVGGWVRSVRDSKTFGFIVVNDGKILFDDTPKQVFQHYKELESVGLAAPQVTYVVKALKEKGWDIDTTATTVEEAKEAILLAIKKREKIC